MKIYFPREDAIQVHQARVKPCPEGFMAGYCWYGSKRKGPGPPPRWVVNVLAECDSTGSLLTDHQQRLHWKMNPVHVQVDNLKY